jgi:hypothetical protein
MNKFTQKTIKEVDFPKVTQKTKQIYRDDGKLFGIDDLDKMIKSMSKVSKQQKKTMKITRIYVMNGANRSSWKDEESFMEYYEGRVKDESKFHEFSQVHITMDFQK